MYYKQFRQNKFRNKKTTFGGRLYDSKHESSVAADLELMKKATKPEERVIEVKPQYNVDIYFDGVTLTTTPTSHKFFRYIADFFVIFADNHEEIWEAKAKITMTDVFRLKWKAVEAVFSKEKPELILRIIQ